MTMMCRANSDDAFDSCRGLVLFDEKHSIAIENEEICYNGIYRILHRKQLIFEDGSTLNYDSPIFCGDEKVLTQIAESIIMKFGGK